MTAMSAGLDTVCLVVPCFNEAARLEPGAFLDALTARPWLSLHFVDDGSTDESATLLEALASRSGRATVLSLPVNQGKAAAVWAGVREVLSRPVDGVGYWDCDLATPFAELDALRAEAIRTGAFLVMGSRVKLLGRQIDRRPLRHYVGRIFSTLASMAVRLPVYDTQCGAKLFRCNDLAREVFAQRFVTRWVFDVELLARIHGANAPAEARRVVEYPVHTWIDIDGSKVRMRDGLRAAVDLWKISRRYQPGREGTGQPERAGAR